MTDPTDPIRLLDNAPARRLWLLAEAVRSVPFDRALDLARSAEAFLVGCEGITNLTSATEPGPQDEQFVGPLAASHQPKRSGIALARISATVSWTGSPREHATRSLPPNLVYRRSKFRACGWAAPGRLQNAQGGPRGRPRRRTGIK